MKSHKLQILNKTITTITEKKDFKKKSKDYQLKVQIYQKLIKTTKIGKLMTTQIKLTDIWRNTFGNMLTNLMERYRKYLKK